MGSGRNKYCYASTNKQRNNQNTSDSLSAVRTTNFSGRQEILRLFRCSKYQESLQELIKDIGVVFNKTILDTYGQEPNLGNAADVAIANNLPIFSMPFYRPFQYIGMPIADIIKQLNIAANEDNNIVIETDECRMLMESEGILIDYINIDIKKTSPCCQAKEFNSIPVLGSLSINPSELELIRKQTHCHTYYDHRRKLKISILCLADGSPLSVSFSAKYYGD